MQQEEGQRTGACTSYVCFRNEYELKQLRAMPKCTLTASDAALNAHTPNLNWPRVSAAAAAAVPARRPRRSVAAARRRRLARGCGAACLRRRRRRRRRLQS